MTDSDLSRFLASGEPFDAWNEEWLGVPLRLQPFFSSELPPREFVGSVRTITVCDSGVVVVDHPRPSEPPQLLAGGHPEADESLAEALVREIAEETGWLVSPICVFGFVHCRHLDTRRPDWNRPFPEWVDPMFVSRADSFSPDLLKPGETPSRLVPWTEIGDLPIGEMQTRWLERATELWRASDS